MENNEEKVVDQKEEVKECSNAPVDPEKAKKQRLHLIIRAVVYIAVIAALLLIFRAKTNLFIANLGFTGAQVSMAERYVNGDGVEVDFQAARKWYTKAADNGSEEAKKALKGLTAKELKWHAEQAKAEAAK